MGKLIDNVALAPDYNVVPTKYQPIIREGRESGEREMVLARWGLVPFFTRIERHQGAIDDQRSCRDYYKSSDLA